MVASPLSPPASALSSVGSSTATSRRTRRSHPFDTTEYDVVSSAFCLEGISQDRRLFSDFLKRVGTLLRPGGMLVATVVRESEAYKVGSHVFPACYLDEGALVRSLERAGFADVRTQSMATSEEHGYSGIMAVTAVLGGPGVGGTAVSGVMPRGAGQQSVRSKIVVLCFLVSAATTGLLAYYSYDRERSSILEGLDRRLTAAAAAVQYALPPDYPDRVEAGEAITPAEHERNVRRLTAFARQADVTFVYTVARRADGFVFSSMSAKDEELAAGTWFAFAEPYASPNPGFAAVFDGEVVFSDEYEDEYGRFRPSSSRRRSPGGVKYVLGADVDITFVSQRLRRTLSLSVLIGTGVFLVVFVVSLVVANRISRPLMDLATHTEKLVESGFTLAADPGRASVPARSGSGDPAARLDSRIHAGSARAVHRGSAHDHGRQGAHPERARHRARDPDELPAHALPPLPELGRDSISTRPSNRPRRWVEISTTSASSATTASSSASGTCRGRVSRRRCS